MVNKVVILEGSNDLTFVNWLINKASITVPANIKIIEVKGKPFFRPYIKKHFIDCVNDEKNQIDYSDMEITDVLLIKDFDIDDDTSEYNDEQSELAQLKINFEKYYISGTTPAPRTLETLFIENDGELLREFVKVFKEFNQRRKQNGKDYFEKLNDKFLFHEFFKFVGKKSKLNHEFFDRVFDDESFSKYPDIQKLIDKIKEFIEK